MNAIKAIETTYQGYRFRSRIEARWAVYFDTVGVMWEYEKDGFYLGEVGCYLPDFWLPELECWIEVKGERPSWSELSKTFELSMSMQHAAFVVVGPIGDHKWIAYEWWIKPYRHLLWDKFGWCEFSQHALSECKNQEQINECMVFLLTSYAVNKSGKELVEDNFPFVEFVHRLGIMAARSARFEHGETPNMKWRKSNDDLPYQP